MKLKQQPDDFQVEELTDVRPTDDGPFSLYRLEKQGWTTPDAFAAIRKRWQIDLRRFSYGGLKDRHARTVQYLTIFHGPRRNLKHQGVAVQHLGQLDKPYDSRDIRANAFRLTLRDIVPDDIPAMETALEEVRRDGVPNYFDDQRFGSVKPKGEGEGEGENEVEGEFIGRLLVRGHFEDALRLALTGPYEHDRGAEKREKAKLLAHWGDWRVCHQKLARGHARQLVEYLINHPQDFRGAVVRLRPELRGLYLSAYQSHLWNRMLARRIQQNCNPQQRLDVRLHMGFVPMYRCLGEENSSRLLAMQLPLPSARLKLADNDPAKALVHEILAEEGMELQQLKVPGVRDLFFSRGERAVLCIPEGLTHAWQSDELHRGKQRLQLSFTLHRGSYATLIVKRITAAD